MKQKIKDIIKNQSPILISKEQNGANKDARKRLHKAVADMLKKQDQATLYSNPEIQKNIQKLGVLIDGLMVFNRLAWVFNWQNLEIKHWPQRVLASFENIKVIFQDKDLLIIYKPSGLPVQAGTGHQKDNLVTWLIENIEGQKIMSQTKLTAGLVHRLDINTQGLMVVAKNTSSLEHLQKQFKTRQVIKKYLTIVDGLCDLETIKQFVHWQCRDKRNPVRQKLFWNREEALAYDIKARQALSIVEVKAVCQANQKSLLEIQIKTGRMHQIRVLMEALGYPLSNDNIYNKKINCYSKGISTGLNLSASQFDTLNADIFLGQNYCLLANFLQFQAMDRTIRSFEITDLSKFLANI